MNTFRLPDETQVSRVHLRTAHIGRDGRFLAAGGYHHHVAVNTWAGKTPAPKNSVRLISYRLAVPDHKTLAILEERARSFGHEARRDGDVLQVRDPNGNWLELALTSEAALAGV